MSALLLALAVGAAAPGPVSPNHPFAWLDPADCAASPSGPILPREKLIGALLEKYPLKLDASAFGPGAQRPAQAIADADCGADGCSGPMASMRALKGAAQDLFDHPSAGGFTLVWGGPGPEPTLLEDKVEAFYDLSRPGYAVRCAAAAPTGVPATSASAQPSFLASLAIASSVDEAGKDSMKDRDPATISLRADRVAQANVGTIKAAVLAPSLLHFGDDGSPIALSGRIGAYVAYNRITDPDPTKETNDLDFGAHGKFVWAGPVTVPVGVNVLWETDDRFKSSMFRADARVRPPLEAILPKGSGYGAETFLTKGSGYTLRFTWDTHLALDYAHIGDPGYKTALATMPSYFRGGYDLDASLRVRRRSDDPAFLVTASYQYRDDWSGHPANANLLSVKGTYLPSDAGHFAFGVEYGRGLDLSSLERSDYVLISIGYRQ